MTAPASVQDKEGSEHDGVAEPTITVTFFRPGEKAFGMQRVTSWTKLFGVMAGMKPTGTVLKEALPGWAPATFTDDHRTKDNVLVVYAAVFDFDNAEYVEEPQPDGTTKKVKRRLPDDQVVTLDRAMTAFPGVERFAYTSWSHARDWPHFRLVVPYTRAVSRTEQDRIWENLAGRMADAGLVIDGQCKDASRLWFLPARRDENFETRCDEGVLLDVDAVLGSTPAASVPDAGGTPAVTDVGISDALDLPEVSTSERLKRASKYLAKMPSAVSGSGGHPATFKAAVALVRGFALDPALAFVLLRDEYNPRCQPRWTDKDLRHKIDSAVKDAKTPLGALLRHRDKLVNTASDATVQADAPGAAACTQRFTCTDLGNAERLAHRHGEDLRFCAPWEKWLVWTGTRWQIANKKQVERFAQVTVRGIYREAAAETDPDRRKALAEHAKQSESNARKVAMIEQAKSLPGIPIIPEELDGKPWLLNVQNGTIDLKTGSLREHRRDDLLTKIAGTSYDANAECPLYDAFLARVLPDEPVRDLVNRLDGYALTGVVPDHIFPIHYGGGRNGKGVHTNTLLYVWGDYARQIPTELLLAKRGDTHPTEKTTLFGTRLAVAVETEENRALNVAFVKQATGGDRISARRMREDFWEFDPVHKLQLSTNHRPTIRETKDAIWERVLLIPWTVKIPEGERDPLLGEKLKAEAPGILAKLVRACLAWQAGGLAIPQAVRIATDQFRSEMDVLGKFISDCCVLDDKAEEGSTTLFTTFVEWAEANNEREVSQTAFSTQLGERGFTSKRDSKTGRMGWRGLRLRDGVSPSQATDTDDYTQGVTSEELERLFDTLSKGSAEGSEGSEATSRLVPHESHNKALTANALQTLQTLQPSTGSSQNHSPATPAAGSPTPNGSGENAPPATPSASLVTTPSAPPLGAQPPLSAVPWNGRAVNDTCNEREPEADDDPGADPDAEYEAYLRDRWAAEA